MTRSYRSIVKVLSFRASPRVLVYQARSALDRWLGAAGSRYKFEQLYLEHGDYWGYETSPYERRKYQLTLDRVLQHRRGTGAILEIGCSVGVFTAMVASRFDQVTALDISAEALRLAESRLGHLHNVRFVRDDFRELQDDTRYDVIVAAETLHYIPIPEVRSVLDQLERHLAADGIVVAVIGLAADDPRWSYFKQIESRFKRVWYEEVVDPDRPHHPTRPFHIGIFSKPQSAATGT